MMIIDIDGNEIVDIDTGETIIDMGDLSTSNELLLVSIVNALVSERDGLQDDILGKDYRIQCLEEDLEMVRDNLEFLEDRY